MSAAPTVDYRAGFLQVVLDDTRPIILSNGFSADSCAASCRIVADVLEYFGVPCRPVPVVLYVFNEEAKEILTEHGPVALQEAVAARNPEDPGGPWSIGVGHPNGPGYEAGAGHVVLWVPDLNSEHGGWIVDPSIDQASRPIKNIVLPPSLFPAGEQFLTVGATAEYRTSDTSAAAVWVAYEHVARHKYRDSPNWHRKSTINGSVPFRHITGEAIKLAKTHLRNLG